MNNATSVPSGLIFVPEIFVSSDCFMILRLRIFQFNVLSRGRHRGNLPYKMALLDVSGDTFCITGHGKCNLLTATGIFASQLPTSV